MQGDYYFITIISFVSSYKIYYFAPPIFGKWNRYVDQYILCWLMVSDTVIHLQMTYFTLLKHEVLQNTLSGKRYCKMICYKFRSQYYKNIK